jgi:beta-N-acetylhexosaminidase
MAARSVIFGCRGPTLDPDERDFLREAAPWGFILFARNIDTPEQVRTLTGALRDTVGRDAPVLIDQEGGRVARMRSPYWREWLPALDEVAQARDAASRARLMFLRYRLIADELRAVGIDVNCAPVLDLVGSGTHAAIRNRCYGHAAAEVGAIGRAVAEGLMAGGVMPVMKHIPGQGRATLDSHLDLPRVTAAEADLLAEDFAAFRALADLPMAMTAHVVFSDIDAGAPATLSADVIRRIRTEIGFYGLLMTDDLSMKALSGDFGDRVTAALAGGCDIVLHCNGDPDEMATIAGAVPELSEAAAQRADAALAGRAGVRGGIDFVRAEYEALTRRSAHA